MSRRDGGVEPLLAAEARVVAAAEPFKDHPLLERLADLGDQPQLRALTAIVIALGVIQRDRKLVGAGARMLAAHTLATFAKDFVKHRVDRTRPRSLGRASADHRPSPGRSRAKEQTSFPSGHAAGAVAVARALARAYPSLAPVAYGAGGVLAAAQIPRCAHYPTDVGAGAVIGVAAEAVLDAAIVAARRAVGTPAGTAPASQSPAGGAVDAEPLAPAPAVH